MFRHRYYHFFLLHFNYLTLSFQDNNNTIINILLLKALLYSYIWIFSLLGSFLLLLAILLLLLLLVSNQIQSNHNILVVSSYY